MLQLNMSNELIFGDTTNYNEDKENVRYILILDPNDCENTNKISSATIYADNPEEICIISKNEKEGLKIILDYRNESQTITDLKGKILGNFDEKELVLYYNNKQSKLFFRDYSFINGKDVPYALIEDNIDNEITKKYFSLPHLRIEFVEAKPDNLVRNLILASIIILTI